MQRSVVIRLSGRGQYEVVADDRLPVELTMAEAAAICAGAGLIAGYAYFRTKTVKLE